MQSPVCSWRPLLAAVLTVGAEKPSPHRRRLAVEVVVGWWPSAIPRRLAVHMESGGARRWRMSQARPSWTRPCPHGWSWTRRVTGPSSSQTDRLARWSPRPRFLLFAPSLTVLLRSLRWCLPLSKIHAFASRGAPGEPAGDRKSTRLNSSH